MSHPTGGGAKRPRILLLALFALAIAALLAPAAGMAKKHKKKDAKVSVMTRNLYLGADLGPALDADNICDAVDAGGEIINQVDLTNFPERSKLLAKEIAKNDPDLVGLQEVALWRDQDPSDYTTTDATHVRYDFLALLQDALNKQGAKYKVAVQQDEFDQELPADLDGDNTTGSGPFGNNPGPVQCGADIDGRLTMRDVILVRKGSGVKTKNPDMGHFENTYDVKLAGSIDVSVTRGWVSVDAKVAGSKKTKPGKFHFVNTHLEAFGDPSIREAQARELFADGGPLQTKQQLVLVGDLNSGSKKDKIGAEYGGFEGDRGAYDALIDDFGMTNLGKRQTCCYPDPNLSSDTIGGYRFDHTVDHVMTKPKIKQIKAKVTGNDPTVTTPSGLVSSDHGGVYSELKLKKAKKDGPKGPKGPDDPKGPKGPR